MANLVLKMFTIIFVMCFIFTFSGARNYYSYNVVNENNKYSVSLGIWNVELRGDTFAPSSAFTTDLEDDLGFGDNESFIFVDFNYRLSNLNGIGFSFFTGSYEAVRNLTRNITLPAEPNDVNVAAGTTVFSEVEYNAFDLYYRRYFSTESNYNFYGLAGIRLNNLKADFSTNATALAAIDFNTPVGYVGVGGDFRISDNFKAFYQVQGVPFSTGGEKINYIEYRLGIDYKFTENWGLNIGYRYNATKAEDDYSRSIKLRYQGFTFGVSGRF